MGNCLTVSSHLRIKSLRSSAHSDQTHGLPKMYLFVYFRVFEMHAFLFSSSSPSTIANILRSAKVSVDLSVLPMLKLGSDTFAKNNFVSEKKLFLALYELHDNMKAWTDLLNNRTRRQNGPKN